MQISAERREWFGVWTDILRDERLNGMGWGVIYAFIPDGLFYSVLLWQEEGGGEEGWDWLHTHTPKSSFYRVSFQILRLGLREIVAVNMKRMMKKIHRKMNITPSFPGKYAG